MTIERDHECYCYLTENLLNCHDGLVVVALYGAFRCWVFSSFLNNLQNLL